MIEDSNGVNRAVTSGLIVSVLILAILCAFMIWPQAAKAQSSTRPGAATNQVALNASTTTLVLASGQNFVKRVICNTDASIIIYAGTSAITSSTGLPIQPKTCINYFELSTAAIYAISASGTPTAAGLQY